MSDSKVYACIIAVLVAIIVILAAATGYFWARSIEYAPENQTEKQIGVSVAITGDGKNWTLRFTSVDPGMAGNQIYLMLNNKGGGIALEKMPLSSLIYSFNKADYIDISGDGDETNYVNPGDYILISTTTYTSGFTYQLLYGAGIASSGTLQ